MNMKASTEMNPVGRMCGAVVVFTILLLCGCGAGGSGQDPDPLVQDFGMAFVRRPLPLPAVTTLEPFTEGGNLFYRDLASPSAPEINVTGALLGELGDVKDVEVSYDGTTLLFAMHMPDDPNAAVPPTWNIWEYEIATHTLARVIADDATADEADDVAPHYLPDGRIIFSSSRQRRFRETRLNENITWPTPRPDFLAVDEDRREHAMLLHVLTRDSGGALTDIRQVSLNQSHDLDPSVLSGGEVVFSRWDNMGSRTAISLYAMHPDGSELHLLYGAHSHDTGTNGATVQFLQPREMPDGRLLTVQMPFSGTQRGGDLLLIDTRNYIENSYPTASNLGVLSGPAQLSATQNIVTTDGTISPGGRFAAAWPLDDGTSRLLVSWSACRVLLNNLIQPCTAANLADPNASEPDPVYGIFLYDMATDSQLPLVVPQEGVLFTDVVAAMPRSLPTVLFDKERAIELEPQAYDEGVGYLDIRSVYDVDGADTTPAGIAAMADPVQTPPDSLPARFLRIVKAVSIPDRDVKQLAGTAFGVSSNQLMREIIGYVPIQPDGSVRVKVPADVPLAISVVDAAGKRIGGRHQNWLQLRPGETVRCNGCHSHNSAIPHGHPEGPVSVWIGSPATGPEFPNTDPNLFTEAGETMAQTLTRHDGSFLWPSVDVLYTDVWSVPPATPGMDIARLYADLSTPAPATAACQANWGTLCRTVINYEQHIHPLWSVNRNAGTCTNCHNVVDGGGAAMLPAGQLDLSDGYDPQVSAHLKSYRELLVADFEQVLSGTSLIERTDPGPIDPDTGQPTVIRYPVQPSMNAAGAAASDRFFTRFAPGGADIIHAGILTPAELRLLAEWLDIGAQYFNDPFAAP